LGPTIAVAKELSTWRGEVSLKKYQSPTQSLIGELEIPENWKTYEMGSGTDASDFIDGVETDELGDYVTYNSPEGNLKFYLPNNTWFNKFSGNVYKFETDTGEVYSLFLSLNSQKNEVSLSLGADDSTDNITVSLKNLNPENGNGWFFELPVNYTRGDREYFKRVSENSLIPFNPGAYGESLKSSWQLFWDKWGVVIQIVASVILAALTSGLSAQIQLLFAEAGIIAKLLPGVSAEVLGWLTTSGSFSVVRSEVLALFLLETAVNLPAAFIDKSFGNDFGFVLGIAFCFFPFVSTYGRLGKWIKGSYSEEAAQQLATKVLNKGFNQYTSQEVLYKFITDELTAEDKRAVSEELTDEELAVFDILMKPDIELSKADRKKVKAVARKLLQTLKETKLVLDWRKKLKTRADVISTVRKVLDDLPRVFTTDLYDQKCDVVFHHIYDSYMGEGESIYETGSSSRP
jgi:hypothetical protein